ncbi:metal-sulfur cluster assembly factor [Lactiplantibacillus mudanjiangensis]|uniref:DNA methyltransferase [Lactobacillus sp.] n=1 Tax=Lactiplantibacillus mudanjiangensis TaxID=1296538 RepID=A0A660E3I6_9LACO|nr:metal-sulfur cluster assembly factor [Lactiplantibacillus mudanjiangensis]VDG20100.1 DNA methyltransferase [Lactobacillus sp.] [Lactiplantibacillus mudanjiangensis]VDG26255.1 DNA methyltransferase [Lactobacillus sp.] [Lactiplantibacillus mudanjiangensis]VDG27415.1 DNA methyltransferase [Lactobacillus sp.] [Lactiplantibacillus mudanjiangensis]VDG33494.1 DNA methyltransferase [Lactobacillus sp.] [Lactiplantibacillus mudanjiangensis]
MATFKETGIAALQDVIDPELGVDIVSLGLIYDVTNDDQGHCVVTMTLTMMGCPLTDVLANGITDALTALPEVKDVEINLVWEPAWSIARMSRAARLTLGV